MNTVSLSQAVQDFGAVVDRVLADSAPLIVDTPSGGVVVLPLDDFESWRETSYLLRTPANATHLRRSIDQAQAGNLTERKLAE